MFIKVAGEKKEYPEGLTVKELIEKEDVETPQYVTVTINDEFVESGAFETTEVKDGDEIEFLPHHPQRGWCKGTEKTPERQRPHHWSRRTGSTGSHVSRSSRRRNHRNRRCR